MKKIAGVLVLGILVVLCFGLLWAYNGPGKNVPEPQSQDQALVNYLNTVNHEIDWARATQLIANKTGGIKTNLNTPATANAFGRVTTGSKGGTFARKALDQILAQPGVIGVRYYYATKTDGSPTIVLVGVNAQGMLMSTGAVEDESANCPPYCD